jgi:dihydroorotase
MGRLVVGARADITIFDPTGEVTVRGDEFESKGRNSPFDGWRLRGRAIHVIVGGHLALRAGKITERFKE